VPCVVTRAYKIGVPMTFGSDLDVEIPGHTRGEMAAAAIENYVEAEIPARTTLQIWTVKGVELAWCSERAWIN
jgi:predicted amidohydrolase YtcJ